MVYLVLAVMVAAWLALGGACAWQLRHDDSFAPRARRWFA